MVVLLAPLASVVVAVTALFLAGDLRPGSAVDPALGVRVALPVAELCRNLAVAAVLGLLVVLVWVIGPSQRGWSRLMDAAAAAASAWAAAAAATGLLTFISATGLTLNDPGFSSELIGYLTGIEFGRAWATETVAAAALATMCLVIRSHGGAVLLLLATPIALVPVLLLGHSGGGADDFVEGPALVLHVLAAGTWVGGLAVVALVAADQPSRLASVLVRYGNVALVCLAAVSLSGAALALLHLGPGGSWGSPYAQLVLVKIGLLLLAGVLGGVIRGRLIRQVEALRTRRGVIAVIGWELIVLAVAMGVAAALVRTPSPESEVPAAPISTRAAALIGRPLPAPLDAAHLALAWRPDVLWIGMAVLLAVGYGVGIGRIRRAGTRWPLQSVIAWYSGLAVLGWLTSGGASAYGQVLPTVHVVRTLLLLVPVPALLIAGAPGRLIESAAMPRTDGSRGLTEWYRALCGLSVVRTMMRPLPAVLLALALLALLYGTGLLMWEARQVAGHEVMTALWLLTGVLLVGGWHRAVAARTWSVALLTLGLVGFAIWMLVGGEVGAGWFSALGWPDPRADQRDAGITVLLMCALGVVVLAVLRLAAGERRKHVGSDAIARG